MALTKAVDDGLLHLSGGTGTPRDSLRDRHAIRDRPTPKRQLQYLSLSFSGFEFSA